MNLNNSESLIDEVMTDNLRVSDILPLIEALEDRLVDLRRQYETCDASEKKKWTSKIKEVQSQINILRQEAAISHFVENSVRSITKSP